MTDAGKEIVKGIEVWKRGARLIGRPIPRKPAQKDRDARWTLKQGRRKTRPDGTAMGALLAVVAGSRREPMIAVMNYAGGGKQTPITSVGKGVTFDSGGLSLRPSAGMGSMKGDMAGAACVAGLMQALAARKANAIGLVGLVENMPDGNAVRPGDVITPMSGQNN